MFGMGIISLALFLRAFVRMRVAIAATLIAASAARAQTNQCTDTPSETSDVDSPPDRADRNGEGVVVRHGGANDATDRPQREPAQPEPEADGVKPAVPFRDNLPPRPRARAGPGLVFQSSGHWQ